MSQAALKERGFELLDDKVSSFVSSPTDLTLRRFKIYCPLWTRFQCAAFGRPSKNKRWVQSNFDVSAFTKVPNRASQEGISLRPQF
jgi:hypothetical protein